MAYRRKTAWSNYSPAPTSEIRITWNPDIEAYECSFPYNANFINWIKTNIPVSQRSMDFDRSRNPQYKWIFVQATLETAVLPMMKAMFPQCRFVLIDKKKVDEYNQGFRKTAQIDSEALKKEFRTLIIAAGVSTELPDKKQYLKAAMYYHPDRNPELADKMSRLNEIWSTVFNPKEQKELQ